MGGANANCHACVEPESRVSEMTMTTANLLLELFVEELPPKALQKLGAAFVQVLSEELAKFGLLEKEVISSDPRDGSQPTAKAGASFV